MYNTELIRGFLDGVKEVPLALLENLRSYISSEIELREAKAQRSFLLAMMKDKDEDDAGT